MRVFGSLVPPPAGFVTVMEDEPAVVRSVVGIEAESLSGAHKRGEARVAVQIHHGSQDIISSVHGERECGPAGRDDFGRDRVDGGNHPGSGHRNVSLRS